MESLAKLVFFLCFVIFPVTISFLEIDYQIISGTDSIKGCDDISHSFLRFNCQQQKINELSHVCRNYTVEHLRKDCEKDLSSQIKSIVLVSEADRFYGLGLFLIQMMILPLVFFIYRKEIYKFICSNVPDVELIDRFFDKLNDLSDFVNFRYIFTFFLFILNYYFIISLLVDT